jgi:hypothetical protein
MLHNHARKVIEVYFERRQTVLSAMRAEHFVKTVV